MAEFASPSGFPESDVKNNELPKDARIISLILKTMGITEYEPRVLNQLMEFMHRYSVQVLLDAKEFSEHADKEKIDLDDIRMATQARVNYSFTQPPPRELLLELAEKKNSIPLPLIPTKFGVHLPPEKCCLTAPNYQVTTASQQNPPPSSSNTSGKKRGRSSSTVSEQPTVPPQNKPTEMPAMKGGLNLQWNQK